MSRKDLPDREALLLPGSMMMQTIYKWLRTFCWRFFSQQFKRSCLPDGPKVGTVALSPRGDWRMPSDACVALDGIQKSRNEEAENNVDRGIRD